MIYLNCISRKQKASCPNSGRNDAVSGNFHFESLREGSHQRQRFAKAQRKPALSPRGLCTGPFTFALTPNIGIGLFSTEFSDTYPFPSSRHRNLLRSAWAPIPPATAVR